MKDIGEETEDMMLSVEETSIEEISTFNNLAFIFGVNINSIFIVGMLLSKTG